MAGYQQETDDNEGKLFVGGLAWESTEESLRDYFEQFGPVESINLKRNKEDQSKHRGFAFVKFQYAEDADKVLNQREAHIVDGSKIDPKSACPIGIKPEQRTKKIFVGGLQAETTDEKLKEYFSEFGQILNNIEYAVDHNTKKKRGFCFIEFASESTVDKIVKAKYHTVAGKRLETKRALSKQQQQEMAEASGIRKVAPSNALIGLTGYNHLATPYAQPVIYIHPDSLSTAYPLGIGGVTAYPAIATGGAAQYASALETLYQPYGAASRDTKHQGKATSSSVSLKGGRSSNPYGKSSHSDRDHYSKY